MNIDDHSGYIVILELVQQFWRRSWHSGVYFVTDCFYCIPHLLSCVSNWILQCGLSLTITYLWHCAKSYLGPSRVSAVLNTAVTAFSFPCSEILMLTQLHVVFSRQTLSLTPPTGASRTERLITKSYYKCKLFIRFWVFLENSPRKMSKITFFPWEKNVEMQS